MSRDVSPVSSDRFKSADKRELFPSHSSDALYQGTAFSRAVNGYALDGFSRSGTLFEACRANSSLSALELAQTLGRTYLKG
jgi:hypothetical protein